MSVHLSSLKPQAGPHEQHLHSEQMLTGLEDDTSTNSATGWVYHYTVPPEAGPGALEEMTQNNEFYFHLWYITCHKRQARCRRRAPSPPGQTH